MFLGTTTMVQKIFFFIQNSILKQSSRYKRIYDIEIGFAKNSIFAHFYLTFTTKILQKCQKIGKIVFSRVKTKNSEGNPSLQNKLFWQNNPFFGKFFPKIASWRTLQVQGVDMLKLWELRFGKGDSMTLQKQHVWVFWGPRCCWVPRKLFKVFSLNQTSILKQPFTIQPNLKLCNFLAKVGILSHFWLSFTNGGN